MNKEEARKILSGILKSVYPDNIPILATVLTAEADKDDDKLIKYAELFVKFINENINVLKQ